MTAGIVAGWALLALYVAAILTLVVRGARGNKSVADYAVGSLAFSPVAVGLALAASTTSAATFIINPGLIAYFGVSGVFGLCVVLPITMSISLIVLTKGFRKLGDASSALTLSQWVGQRYQSRGFALYFALLSLLLITFIVLILVGLSKVIAASLDLPEAAVLVAVVVFSFGYMMFGGANSMVYTNAIQAVIMLLVAAILLGSGWRFLSDGIGPFLSRLGHIDANLATLYNPASPLFRDAFEVIFCTVVVGAAIVCQPHIITKSLLLKEERDVNRYLATGIAVQTIFFAVVIVGLYARLAFPELLDATGRMIPPDGVVSTYLVTQFPWYVAVIVFLGLIAAGMSTLEGLIQSLSIIITNDLIHNVYTSARGRELSGSALFRLHKSVIVGLAIVSLGLAYRQLIEPNLSVAIFAQLGVYAYFAAAFVPVLFGTFLADTPKLAAMAAAVTAPAVHFLIYYTGQGWFPYFQGVTVKNPGVSTALGIVAAGAVGGGLYLIARPRAGSAEP